VSRVDYEKLLYFIMEFLEKFGVCMQCEHCDAITVNRKVLCKVRGETDLMIMCKDFKFRVRATAQEAGGATHERPN
jgi:hypothetical protein